MTNAVTSYAEPEEPEVWERAFLEAYVNEYGVIGKAADAAGVHENAVRNRAKKSESFRLMFETAKRMVDDMMEFEAMRRALEPNDRPIYQRGKLVGVIKEYDNKHLQWMLERRMPEKYHLPTRVEFAGDGDGVVNLKLELNPGSGGDDEEEN